MRESFTRDIVLHQIRGITRPGFPSRPRFAVAHSLKYGSVHTTHFDLMRYTKTEYGLVHLKRL